MLSFKKSTGLFAVCLLFGLQNVNAQKVGSRYPSSEGLIEEGIKLHDNEEYKDALKKYNKIYPGDSLYYNAMYEAGLTLIELKQYTEAIDKIKQVAKVKNHLYLSSMYLLASAYDYSEKFDSAEIIYNQLMKEYPGDPKPMLEMMITKMRQKKYDDSKELIGKMLKDHPYYSDLHKRIAILAASTKHNALSIMASQFALVCLPGSGEKTGYLIDLNDKVAGIKIEESDSIPASFFKASEFDELNSMVRSKIVDSKSYKSKLKLNFLILKQLQLIFENLPSNTEDPIAKFYLDFYKEVASKDQFKEYALSAYQYVNNPQISSKVKKLQKTLTPFYDDFRKRFYEDHNTIELTRNGVTEKVYLKKDNSGFTEGRGPINSKKEFNGYWEWYHENGILSAEGKYVNGKKEGVWKFYHENGKLKSVKPYKNGEETDGNYEFYFSNGALEVKYTLKNSKPDGILNVGNSKGLQVADITYKDGKANGKRTEYDSYGVKQAEYNNVNGEPDGDITVYHPNGKVNYTCSYKKGNRNGSVTYFSPEGQKLEEGTFENDKKVGVWKSYHLNGKINSEDVYVKGKKNGLCKEYFIDGKVSSEINYANGIMDGSAKYYLKNGKVYDDRTYKAGMLMSVKITDSTGKVLYSAKETAGSIKLVDYNQYGQKTAEGMFENGTRTGTWKFYDESGNLSSEINYSNGRKEGVQKAYYSNGKLKSEILFEEGDEQGYAHYFYIDGKLEKEGFYKDGMKYGVWTSYFPNSTTNEKEFYYHDDKFGTDSSFAVDGKIWYNLIYDQDLLIKAESFDSTGRVIKTSEAPLGNGRIDIYFPNGSIFLSVDVKAGSFHGTLKRYHLSGKLLSVENYEFGRKVGEFMSYDLQGNLKSKGIYKEGKKDSVWTFYRNGKVYSTEQFTSGQKNGEEVVYHANGKVAERTMYLDGDRNGYRTFFGEDGSLAARLLFANGELVSYSYLGKDGKMVPEIIVKGNESEIKAFYQTGAPSFSLKLDAKNNYQNECVLLNPNGTKIFQIQYKDGRNNGVASFYSNGKLARTEVYEMGYQVGTQIEYHENGKEMKKITFVNDEKHGPVFYYDQNGKLIKTTQAFNGYE